MYKEYERYLWHAARMVGVPRSATAWFIVTDLWQRARTWHAYATRFYGPTSDPERWISEFAGTAHGGRPVPLAVLDSEELRRGEKALGFARSTVETNYDRARLGVLHRSPASWTYYLLRDERKVAPDVLEMPPLQVQLMVADWLAAARDQTGEWDAGVVRKWWTFRKHAIALHPTSRKLVERLLWEQL